MLSFALAVLLLMGTPGPGVMSAAGMGAAYGFRPALRYVLGLFLGNLLVMAAVISGLSALVLANPGLRTALFIVSTAYLLYLAARIALAGSRLAFVKANRKPGVMAGLLLQPINPKAYLVNTSLLAGYPIFPDAYWSEVLVKLAIVNTIWVPIHLGWLFAGATLERLDLPERTHRMINICMALAMLFVVALALLSTLRA